MKQIIKNFALSAFVMAFGVFGVIALTGDVALATDPGAEVRSGVNAAGGSGQRLQPRIQDVINVLLFILGAIAVIMIVIGGIKYTLSNGDSSEITSAKNTILYAVIGLVVAMLAYAIVNFVIGALG